MVLLKFSRVTLTNVTTNKHDFLEIFKFITTGAPLPRCPRQHNFFPPISIKLPKFQVLSLEKVFLQFF